MSISRSSLVVSAVSGAALAGLLAFAACQSAGGHYNPATGEVEIHIVGDDGKVVTAKGYEAALQQAMQYKKEAEQRGDQHAADDWGNIINNLLDKKGHVFDAEKKNLQMNGTLTSSVNQQGQTVWSWVWTGGPGSTQPDPTDPDPTPGEGQAQD